MSEVKRWRRKKNVGRHLFKDAMGKKQTILPGQELICTEESLGDHVIDYECLDSSKAKEKKAEEPGKLLQLAPRGKGFFDLINPDNPGKPLNDRPLKKDEVKEIVGEMFLWLAERLTPPADEPETQEEPKTETDKEDKE